MPDQVHLDPVKSPPGMTEEQLHYFAEVSAEVAERASKRAVKHYRNRALAGFLVLLLGIGFVQRDNAHNNADGRKAIVNSGRVVSVSGCNRDFNTQTAVRGVLVASKDFAATAARRGTISQADYKQRITFYDSQLAKLTLPDCRTAASVVTDDPRDIRQLPTPLYPGKPSG